MKFRIEWHYSPVKKQTVSFTSDEFFNGKDALAIGESIANQSKTKDVFFLDDKGHWTIKEMKKLVAEVETEPHDIEAYFDGGYDIDSKKAGVGAVIFYTKNNKRFRIRKNSIFEEMNSNNEAEYAAFWFMLRELEELGVHHQQVEFYGDSQVILNQLNESWPVFEEEFTYWLNKIEDKMKELGIQPAYNTINRKDNKEADSLATQAMNEIPISSCLEIND